MTKTILTGTEKHILNEVKNGTTKFQGYEEYANARTLEIKGFLHLEKMEGYSVPNFNVVAI